MCCAFGHGRSATVLAGTVTSGYLFTCFCTSIRVCTWFPNNSLLFALRITCFIFQLIHSCVYLCIEFCISWSLIYWFIIFPAMLVAARVVPHHVLIIVIFYNFYLLGHLSNHYWIISPQPCWLRPGCTPPGGWPRHTCARCARRCGSRRPNKSRWTRGKHNDKSSSACSACAFICIHALECSNQGGPTWRARRVESATIVIGPPALELNSVSARCIYMSTYMHKY